MKRYTSLLAMALLVAATGATAQPTEEWVSYYDAYGYNDYGQDIATDNSGNVYVTGFSRISTSSSYDYEDWTTVKYNSDGVKQWEVIHNGLANKGDRGQAIAADAAGNVYVTGRSNNGTSYYDCVTIKFNTDGVQQWIATYNGPGNSHDEGADITIDDEGNVYVTGHSRGITTYSDYATIKYDSNGVEQWVTRYDGPQHYYDLSSAVEVDEGGNVYVTGYGGYTSSDFYDYITVKYNSDGTEQWASNYNYYSRNSRATGLALDEDGNVFVTGNSGSPYNMATVKYDSAGTQKWVKRYNGPGNGTDQAEAIAVDDGGNVYVAGWGEGSGTSVDITTIKYSPAGDELWVSRFDGPLSGDDRAYDMTLDKDNNVYLAGYSRYSSPDYIDCITLMYDTDGIEQWHMTHDGPANWHDRAYALAVDKRKNVYITGNSTTSGGYLDFVTIRYSQILTDIDIVSIDSPADSVLSARTYTPQATITNYEGDPVDFPVICEFDSSGILVYCDTVQVTGLAGEDTTQVTFADWATGQADGITYTMTVFAAAEDDGEPENDTLSKEVYAAWSPPDVGPVSLDVPGDSAYLGTTYAPQATVKNFNEYPALSFDVVCEFSSVEVIMYSDTVHVTDLDSLATTQVTFADWTPTADLPYRMTVFTICEDDRDPSNDSKSKVVLVLPPDRDVAAIAIDAPPDEVATGSNHIPKATVKNLKADAVSFDVVCEFDSAGVVVYADTVLVSGLAGGDSRQVSFAGWSAAMSEGVSYTMLVLASTEGDMNPSNNMLTKSVVTIPSVHDVAPVAIISPPDQILAGHTYTPTAEVKNLGTDPETFDVRCEFDSAGVVIYSDLVSVTSLAGGQVAEVSFAPWTAGATGEFSYTMSVATLLATDLNPANDLLSKDVVTTEALADLDIQDYVGNLSANTMELTGVTNSIVVGSYVMVNPDDREINFDVYDGPGNVDLDLAYSCTDLSTYGGGWTIPAANINPDLAGVNWLGLGTGAQNILQAYIPNNAHFETYVGKVTAHGTAEDGSTDADEFTLKVNVVMPKGGGKPSSFSGEPLAEGNVLYWPNFGFGEQGFNLYRAESEEFIRLNTDLMDFTEYTDYDVAAAVSYQYKLGLAMGSGNEILIGPLTLTSSESVGLPVLYQNWPNPWMEQTEISYFLPQDVSFLTLKVYDVSGKLVKTLASGAYESGHHSVVWEGKDDRGLSVSSGVYFARFKAGDYVETARMVILR